MARSNPAATASEMLGSLKEKLGFSRDESRADYDVRDDYGDDGFSQRWDDEFAEYGADYDENVPVGGYRPATTRSSRFGHPESTPKLVSIDDVKAHTPLPDLKGEPSGGREGSAGPSMRRVGERNLIDETAPAASSPAYNASLRSARARSEGLDSLFEPSSAPSSQQARTSSAFDPYEAYSSSRPVAHVSSRALTVIRPIAYDDVERVARAVKSGDVVVLALRATSDELAKRILDFSFGVASALDANVESPAAKVFAIARGGALTDEERRDLKAKGVL